MPASAPPKPPKGHVTAQGIFAEVGVVEQELKNHQQIFAPKLQSELHERAQRIIRSRLKNVKDQDRIEAIASHAAKVGTQYVFANSDKVDESQLDQLVADALTVGIASSPTLNQDQETAGTEEKVAKAAVKEAKQAVEKNHQDIEKAAVLAATKKDLTTLEGTDSQTQSIIVDEIQDFKEEPTIDSSLTEDKLKDHVSGFLTTYKKEYQQQLPAVVKNPTFETLQTARENSYTLAQAELAQNTGTDSTAAAQRVSLSLGLTKPKTPEHLEPYGLGRAQPNPLTFANAAGGEAAEVGISLANRSDYQQKGLLYLLATSPDIAQKEQEISATINRLHQEGNASEVQRQQKLLHLIQKAKTQTVKDPKTRQKFSRFFERVPGGRNLAARNAWKVVYTHFNQSPAFYVPQYLVTERSIANRAMGSFAYQLGDFSPSAQPILRVGSLVGGAKGALSAGRSAAGIAKTAGSIAKVGAVAGEATNPVGWALLAAQMSPMVKKAAKAAGALIAYLIAMFGLKFIGLVTGLAFGAITGLPLLFIPGIGIPLYIGWVSFWGIYGWLKPLNMLNIAWHPFEAISNMWHGLTSGVSNAFGAFGNAGSTIGSVFTGGTPAGAIVAPAAGAASGAAIGFLVGGPVGAVIGAVVGAGVGYLASGGFAQIKSFLSFATGASQATIGGLFASAGSFLTGMGATVVNGLVGAAGSALGGAISFGSSLFSGLSGLIGTPAAIGTLTAVPVFGAVGAIAIGSTIIGIATAASFFNPEGQGALQPTTGDNEFYTITKTAEPPTIVSTDLPTDITFKIRLQAKEVRLTNIQITDTLSVNGETTNFSRSETIIPPCSRITELEPRTAWDCEFQIQAAQSWDNSTVTNTINIQTTPEGETQPTQDSATVVVIIGEPPNICGIFNIQGNWSAAELNNINGICDILTRSPRIVSLIQNAGEVILIKALGPPSPGVCGTVNGRNAITIYCNMESTNLAKYAIIHELGHVIGNYNGTIYQTFLNSVYSEDWEVPGKEGLVATYSFAGGGANESFAEMIADYVVSDTYNFLGRDWHDHPWQPYPGGPWVNPGAGFTTFGSDWNRHYDFAKSQIFGGVEY